MVAHKAACQTLSKAFLSLWRHVRGLAGAGDISHKGFLDWRSALWCSFLLWSLPVLQQWSSLLAASVCSVWSSAWLCLVADEVDRSVVLALLQVAFLGKCDNQRLGPRGWPFSCLPDVAVCCESGDYVLSVCLDSFCWDAVNSSCLSFLQWNVLNRAKNDKCCQKLQRQWCWNWRMPESRTLSLEIAAQC